MILDHPLREGSVITGHASTTPRVLQTASRSTSSWPARCVHHRGGIGDFTFDPSAEFRRAQGGERVQDPRCGRAIGGKVVAGQHREGGGARGLSARQCCHDESRRDRGASGFFRSLNNIRMTLVEFAGLWGVAITLLGDGQRDDARCGIGQSRDQLRRVFRGNHGLNDRADHRCAAPAPERTATV